MMQAVKFWDKVAVRDKRTGLPAGSTAGTTVAWAKSHLKPSDSVLDFACGSGLLSLALAGGVGGLTGIDTSPQMIAGARLRAGQAAITNANFQCIELSDPVLEAESFDAVLAFNILHLLPEPEAIIERIHNLLKPGGKLITATACLGEGFCLRAKLILLISRLGLVPKFKSYSVSELERVLGAGDLKITDSRQLPGTFHEMFIVAVKPK